MLSVSEQQWILFWRYAAIQKLMHSLFEMITVHAVFLGQRRGPAIAE